MSQVLFSKKENPIIAALEGHGTEKEGKLVRANQVSSASIVYTPTPASAIYSKIIFTMSQRFHFNYQQVTKQMEPLLKPFRHMFDNLGSMMVQMGDEGEDLSRALTVQMDQGIEQMTVQFEEGFKAVGVENHREFREKQRKIASYEKEAGRGFFENGENRAVLEQIDKNMVQASAGQLSLTAQKTIEEYWEYIGRCSDGYETHKKGYGKLFDSFFKGFRESVACATSSMGIFTDRGKVVEQLKAQLNDKLEKAQAYLRREARGAPRDVGIVNRYQILILSIIVPVLINAHLRSNFEGELIFLEKTCKQKSVTVPEKMVHLRKEYYSSIRRNIEFLKDFIEYEDKEMADNLKKDIESEVEIITDPNQTVIRERAEGWAAYSGFKRELDRLKAALPQDTPFETLVRKQFKIDASMQTGGLIEKATDEMMLDLSQLENPTLYFYEKLKSETEAKAAEWKEFLEMFYADVYVV